MSTVVTALILIAVIGFAVRAMWRKHKTGSGCGCSRGHSCQGCAQNTEAASACQYAAQQSNR